MLNSQNYIVSVLDSDGVTSILTGLRANVTDLNGRALQLAQIQSALTTHRFNVPFNSAINNSKQLFISFDGELFVIDYVIDPGKPFRKMYLDAYAHRSNGGIA